MKATTAIATLVVTLALAACGSSDSQPQATEANPNDVAIQTAQEKAISKQKLTQYLTDSLNAKPDSLNLFYEFQPKGAADTCSIVVIMSTPEEIATYEGAGDTVIKNPTGTAGVKISGSSADKPACYKAASDALETW